MRLGITVTPKVNGVLFHIGEFCFVMGRGHGPWCEQTEESAYHNFKET